MLSPLHRRSVIVVALAAASWGPTTAKAQEYSYRQDFQGQLDGRWVPTPVDVQVLPGAPGQRAIRLSRPDAYVVLQQVANPGVVTFSIQPSTPADSFVVAFSRSCDGGINWRLVREISVSGNGVASAPTHVDIPVDVIGSCNFQWSLPTVIRGASFLDDVSIVRLSESDSTRVALVDEIQRQTAIAEEVRNLAQARSDLQKADSLALNAAHSLADIATDAYTFQSLNQLGVAVSSRATLANPLTYPDYLSVEAELLRISPPVVQAHVASQRSTVENLFTGLQKAISGNWLGAISNIADAVPAVRNFRNNFQATFALTAGEGGKLTGNVTRPGEDRKLTARRLYTSSDTVLERMQQETDSLVHSMLFAAELALADQRTAAQADSALGELIALANLTQAMGPRDLRLAMRRSRTGSNPADLQMVTQFETQLRQRNAAVRTTGDRNDIINRTRSLLDVLSRLPHIQTDFQTLLVQQQEFFARQVSYLCRVSPLTGVTTESRTKWDQNARAALHAMRLAQLSFHRAQVQGPRPGVPSDCPVDRSLNNLQLPSN